MVIVEDDGAGWFSSLLGKRSRIALHSDQMLGRLSQVEVVVGAQERATAMRHLHSQLVINIVTGSLLLSVDNAQERHLRQGTTVLIPQGSAHRWRGDGAHARALLTFSPGGIEALLRACTDLPAEDQRYLSKTFGTEIFAPEIDI